MFRSLLAIPRQIHSMTETRPASSQTDAPARMMAGGRVWGSRQVRLAASAFASSLLAAPVPAATAPEVGVYEGRGPHHRIVVSPRMLGERRILVLTDLGTGAIRGLFPHDEGGWVAGETILSPEPPAHRVTFDAHGEAPPDRLEIHDLATDTRWEAERVALPSTEVEIHRDGLTLRGTLHRPAADGPHPSLLLLAGSEGEADRHSLDALPYVLAHAGFAVLAADKRGTGSSEGSWDVDHPTLAADAEAWIDWLARQPGLDERIGIYGFSEGAWLAPLVASRSPRVRFLVAVSGGALPKSASFLHQARMRMLEEGLAGERLEAALAERRATMDESRRKARTGDGATAFDQRMVHDPEPEWSAFRGPVLVLFGEDDVLVPAAASAERMREVLASANHPDYTIRLFPRAAHSLFRTVTGAPSEFFRMQGLGEYVPGYWETLLHWLDTRVPRP